MYSIEVLSSFKTFTWSFQIGYETLKINTIAFNEDDARSYVLSLLNKITKSNVNYSPIEKRYKEIMNISRRILNEKKEIENSIVQLQQLRIRISDIKKEKSYVENHIDDYSYDFFVKEMNELDKKMHKCEMDLRDFDMEEVYERKLKNINSRVKNIEAEKTELDKKKKEFYNLFDSIHIVKNSRIDPANIRLDFKTKNGYTIEEIINQSPIISPFYHTTLYNDESND